MKKFIFAIFLLGLATSVSAQITQADLKEQKEGYAISITEIQYMSLLLDKEVTEAGKGEYRTLFVTMKSGEYLQYAVFKPENWNDFQSCIINYHNKKRIIGIITKKGWLK